ncbi:peptidase S10 [Corallincola luteus]|uniref:Peptidase S10 n=1 Tax=Corallincola luteus TaxID=1775177 RepID=A0ABY2ANU4_9GAMM|nr:peptidase S10 [Corallincola luteus]TCI04569.1 peptidase S10 [Corallincola luteus]
MKPANLLFISLLSILLCRFAIAEEATEQNTTKALPEPVRVEKKLSGKFNDKKIEYRVIAADTHLVDDDSKPMASIFSTAYIATGKKKSEQRPLIFFFNGGPGSASVWLHLGGFGPKRVVVPSNGENAGAPPYPLIDNPLAMLDIADLVFVDPVGTGYSRAIGEYQGTDFWGVKKDAEVLSRFVRHFISEHKRWNSPRYLAGESYGTTRIGALVRELQEGWNAVNLNGILLISAIVDYQTGDFFPGNEQPFMSFLPTYAATAWYHDALPNKPEQLAPFIEEVKAFVLNEYSVALLKGSRLTTEERAVIIEKLHQYTGLSKQYLAATDLRIHEMRFMKELLREQGKVVGRLDSRYLGTDADSAGETFEADPSGYGIAAAYTAAINDYLGRQIGVERNEIYQILSSEVYRHWDWSMGGSPREENVINVAPLIAKGMRQNRDLRIFVANGYYDMATPFFATEQSFAHYGIDPKRVTMTYYPAGHMMYVHEPSLKQLTDDVRRFIETP